MRITLGKYKRRYVYDIRLGSRAVKAVYYGRRKIWPTLNDLAERVTLAIPQGEDGAFWHHAIGVLQGGYTQTASGTPWAHACIGGKWFNLIREYAACPAYPLAGYDAGTLLLGDNGALVSEVSLGDEVEVQVSIPQHRTNSFRFVDISNSGSTERWHTRFLPGTRLLYSHNKGRKKVCPWAYGSVVGEASGKTYFTAPWHNHGGHGRGSTGNHWINPNADLEPDYDEDVFCVTMYVGGNSTIDKCYLVFPAFTRTFRLKVTDIVRHG